MRFENATDLTKPAVGVLPKGTHYWCQCGQSKTPPYCDGSHAGSDISPLAFESDGVTPIAVCACGLTKNPPFCDGSHVDY